MAWELELENAGRRQCLSAGPRADLTAADALNSVLKAVALCPGWQCLALAGSPATSTTVQWRVITDGTGSASARAARERLIRISAADSELESWPKPQA